MARVRRSGQAFATLNETEITLEQVVSGLGFRAFTTSEERTVRDKLGEAIGQWIMTGGDYTPEARLSVREIRGTLLRIARQLDEIKDVLSAAGHGLHHIHNIE